MSIEQSSPVANPAATRSGFGRSGSRVVKVGAGILVFVLVGFLWEGIIAWLKVPEYIAPPPSAIIRGLVTSWDAIWYQAQVTALEAAIGFLLGTSVAVALAVLFLYLRPLRTGLMPVAIGVSTVPLVAIAPILVLIFGTGLLSKVVMTSMICFFPTLVNLDRGLDAVDDETRALFQVLDATPLQFLLKVRLPTARPYFFSALRVTASAAVIGAIVAEWVNGERGLGLMIVEETYNFNAVLLWADIVVAIGLAVLFFLAVVLLDEISSRHVVR